MTAVVTHTGGTDPQTHKAPRPDAGQGVAVCRFDDLLPERGVAALVDRRQIAVFRTFDGDVYAIDNRDPFTGVFVLSRGIVGTRGDAPVAISPLHKQAFDLRTGVCLDDPAVSVATHPIWCRDGVVYVAVCGGVT